MVVDIGQKIIDLKAKAILSKIQIFTKSTLIKNYSTAEPTAEYKHSSS